MGYHESSLREHGSAGGINALQGGSFSGGALAGVGFGAAGRASEAIAPRLMERSLGITPRQLRYGAEPGREVLSEWSGMTPGAVNQWAAGKAHLYSHLLNQMLYDAGNQGARVDLNPARQFLDREIQQATARSSKPVLSKLQQLREQLEVLPDGTPISSAVHPVQARRLKQGLDDTIGAWEKDSEGAPKRVKDAAKAARRRIDQKTDRVIAGHKEVNDKLASLLTAAKPKGKPQGLLSATLGSGGLGGSILRYSAIPGLGYYEARRAGASMPEAMATGLALEGLNAPATAISTRPGFAGHVSTTARDRDGNL